jgi:hypothetical protein
MGLAPFCTELREWGNEKLELKEGRRDGCQVLIYIDMEISHCGNSR